MADLVVGCAEVNVIRVGIPRFTLTLPTSTVQVRDPTTALVIKNPSLRVTVERPASQIHLVLPIAGPPGSAGSAGGGIYVQASAPVEGTDTWYWFETDGAGNLTGNEYVYDPDGL